MGALRSGFVLFCVAVLSACSLGQETTQQGAGLGVGLATGAATGNPLIGLAAGVIAIWAPQPLSTSTSGSSSWPCRVPSRAPLATPGPGDVIAWVGGGTHGTVELVHEFGEATRCRESIFSRDDPEMPKFMVATVCRRDGVWHWAQPEPRADLDALS